MDTNNKRSVDDILAELRGTGAQRTAAKNTAVDDILAGMGLAPKKSAPMPRRPMPSAPTTGAAAPEARPAAPAPPPVSHAPAAPVPPPPVSHAPAAPVRAWAQPPPAQAAVAQTQPPPVPERAAAPPAAQPIPAPAPPPPVVMLESDRPREQGSEPKAARGGKFSEGTGSIWDIKPNATQSFPRLGKAAALGRVTPDKFAGDTELLSWFSEEGEPPSREQRKAAKQADKAEKKMLAAQRRDEKLRAKYGYGEADEPPEDAGGQPGYAQSPPPQTAREGSFGLFVDGQASPPAVTRDTAPFAAPAVTHGTAPFAPPAVTPDTAPFAPPAVTHGTAPFTAPAITPDTAPFAAPVVTRDTAPFAAPVVTRDTAPFAPPAVTRDTAPFAAPAVTPDTAPFAPQARPHGRPDDGERRTTRPYDTVGEDGQRVPSASFTHEFEPGGAAAEPAAKNLFLDDMMDDRFREFFRETVAIAPAEPDRSTSSRARRRRGRSAVLTGEFGKLAELAEQAELDAETAADDGFDDYSRPQDAEAIEADIVSLCGTLTRRTVFTAAAGLVLLWMGLAFSGALWLPEFAAPQTNPAVFTILHLALVAAAIAVNFTTVASGIAGLFTEPTVDCAPALASVAGLLQGVVLMAGALTGQSMAGVLYTPLAVIVLAFNSFGKRVRAATILRSFRLTSAGYDHSAAYVLDNRSDIAYNVTKGLDEDEPVLLASRPTALVKGFMRHSFSQHASDRTGRIIGLVLLVFALAGGVLSFIVSHTHDVFSAITSFAGVMCIGAPLSSTLVSAIPGALLQRAAARVGAVVPGWSAIEELGRVNVVMATAGDIFPPSSVSLGGIKTFEKERIDLAILYAASVLIEGCHTLRGVFTGVIQGKTEMLYKVESLSCEAGRGFTAWVQNSRVVIGSREMLQRHDIAPPPIETELKHVPAGHMPVYLAVSGKLFAMFILAYGPDPEVQGTLDSLVKSGVSLLVHSDDMNVTEELVERAYDLPHGTVKVLGKRELDILEPMTAYLPESEGVMTHIGTFASFIGGMRAAAGCAAAERLSGIVQMASVALITLLCMLLIFSGGVLALPVLLGLLYQAGWSVLSGLLPLTTKY